MSNLEGALVGMIDRIAVLGGSSLYIPEFIASILSHNLCVQEVTLIGRTEAKLAIVAKFCQRLADKSGFPLKITHTTDLTEGVRDAAFILNNIRVGGMSARLRDEKMPPRFGLIGDETLGAGGIANGLRTLPVLFQIASTIEAAAPNAVMINLTNPLGICMEGLTKYTQLKVVGICDLPETTIKKTIELLRLNGNDWVVDYIGLNHVGWIQDVRVGGRSCMSRAIDRILRENDEFFERALVELFRLIPVKPVHLFFYRDSVLKKQQALARFRAQELQEAEEQILALYADPHLNEIPALTRARNAVWYRDTIVPLIKALSNKAEQRFILCTKNNGAIRDLPEDASVEVPAVVSQKGWVVQPVGSCPRFLKGLFISIKESDRLVVEAVRHRSYEYALQALAVHPLVGSLESARAYLDQVIKDDNLELH